MLKKSSSVASQFSSRLVAERFEHQNNVLTIAMMRKLGMVLPRLRRPRR
jgi:hypothetical protein